MSYLDEWEESVQKREGFNKDENNRIHLILGLRMTGKVELPNNGAGPLSFI